MQQQWDATDCIIVFLYWLLFQPAYHDLQKTTDIPHSNFCQHFGLYCSIMVPSAEQIKSCYMLMQHCAISQETTVDHPEFRGCATLLMDSIHILKWRDPDPDMLLRKHPASSEWPLCQFIHHCHAAQQVCHLHQPAYGA